MIETYLIIIDTNILFHQNKEHVVSPDFDKFLDKHSEKGELILYIPEVVEGEILFQQTSSALKTFDRISSSINNLSTITDNEYGLKITADKIKKDIKQRFDKWKKYRKANDIASPIESIQWQVIINNAVWRKGIFDNPKNEDAEKGFRDAIILETVVDFTQKNRSQNIIFLCKDTLLREETEKRLLSSKKFSTYSELNEFESYLRLRSEELESNFVKNITDKAKSKFFTYNNYDTLVYKENLSKRIRNEFESELSTPEDILKGNPSYEPDIISEIEASPTGKGTFTIKGKPEFIERKNKNTFFWRSIVKYVRPYKFSTSKYPEYANYSYKVIFHVYWNVNISVNNIFTKMEITKIEIEDRDLFDLE